MTVRISVALCTHNGAKFIRDQIRSICLQSLPPDEIVLSDDASSDGCVALARQALAECRQERPGLSLCLLVLENRQALRATGNFEQALRQCAGELIVLCDQDDVWPQHRVARMAAEFAARPELLLLHSDARMVDALGRPLGRTLFQSLEVRPWELERIHAGAALDVLLRRNLVTGATTMLRRELLKPALPFPPEWVHDEWLALVATAVGTIDVLEEGLIDYRQHASNQIGARRYSLAEKLRLALRPRGRRYGQRARKVELLLHRLLSLRTRVAADTIAKVSAKLAHQRYRADLPADRMARLGPIAREIMSGGYRRFSRPLQAIVQDLFESP